MATGCVLTHESTARDTHDTIHLPSILNDRLVRYPVALYAYQQFPIHLSGRGSRGSVNGPPDWHMITSLKVLDADQVDMITGSKPDVIELIKSDSTLKKAFEEHEHGGGGFYLAGSPAVSTVTRDITFKLKCKSHHAFGCPASIRLVFRATTKTVHLEAAMGWEHKHTGELRAATGLPPSVKVIVDQIVSSNPGIKLKDVKNQLWEVHSLPKVDFDSKVDSYFYRSCQARRAYIDVSSGISSFGTAQSFVDTQGFFDKLATHTPTVNHGFLDVAGVIGSMLDQELNRACVLFSTPKMLLDTYIQSIQGYSKGQLHGDFTFKMLQEQIPFLVLSVPDIQQHVHITTMGPCTHQDKEMLEFAYKTVGDTIHKLIKMLILKEWPSNFTQPLKDALTLTYEASIRDALHAKFAGVAITADMLKYMPASGMADAADAFGNAGEAVFVEEDFQQLMCWVHVWRAVKANHWRLRENTKEAQELLYDDLNFIHNLPDPRLVDTAIPKFREKWVKLREDAMVAYLDKEWLWRKFARAHTDAGLPSDNNTLESFNRTVKATPEFGKTTSLGLCLNACVTITYRTSRDAKFIATVQAPVVKKADWVAGQKLVEKSFFKLTYKMGDAIVVPSESLLPKLPGRTIQEKRVNMSVWVQEYISLMKNPTGYHKIAAWDFDMLMDYAYSFYIVKPITSSHKRVMQLAEAGIIKACTCPRYLHYHACKHGLGAAIFQGLASPPAAFSTAIVGKRAASPGRKSCKRTKCLVIDH